MSNFRKWHKFELPQWFFFMIVLYWNNECRFAMKWRKIIFKNPNFCNHHIFISYHTPLNNFNCTVFPVFSAICVCTVRFKLLHAVCTFRYYQNSVCRGHTWFSRGDNLSNNLHIPFGGFGFWTTYNIDHEVKKKRTKELKNWSRDILVCYVYYYVIVLCILCYEGILLWDGCYC